MCARPCHTVHVNTCMATARRRLPRFGHHTQAGHTCATPAHVARGPHLLTSSFSCSITLYPVTSLNFELSCATRAARTWEAVAKLFVLLLLVGWELVPVPVGEDVGVEGELLRMVTVMGPSLVCVDTDPEVCVSRGAGEGPVEWLWPSGLLPVLKGRVQLGWSAAAVCRTKYLAASVADADGKEAVRACREGCSVSWRGTGWEAWEGIA